MRICITFGEIMKQNRWNEFCDICGINPWCINEGLADHTTEKTLTPEQFVAIGLKILIKHKDDFITDPTEVKPEDVENKYE